MDNTEQLNLPSQVMMSPANAGLALTLFKGREGVETCGVTTYEGVLTFSELAQHFVVEANSDALPEEMKKQRDVDQSRVNGIKRYFASGSPVFPGMTFFADQLEIKQSLTVGNRGMVVAELPAFADRFICDGQGRTTFIQWLLQQDDALERFGHYTMAFKLVVTHTNTLSDPLAVQIIKQVFADYHCHLLKPNKSVSKFFDSSTPFARLANQLLELSAPDGGTIKRRIALHGRLKRGHLWTFDQYQGMLLCFLKLTPASANRQLDNQENFESAFDLCESFLGRVFSILPLAELDTDAHTARHDELMFTKAIFAKALAYTGRSLVDEMLLDDTISWSKFDAITLPILSKADKFWLKNNVTMLDGDSIKIIKGTDRRIGNLLCRQLRIYPCQELSA